MWVIGCNWQQPTTNNQQACRSFPRSVSPTRDSTNIRVIRRIIYINNNNPNKPLNIRPFWYVQDRASSLVGQGRTFHVTPGHWPRFFADQWIHRYYMTPRAGESSLLIHIQQIGLPRPSFTFFFFFFVLLFFFFFDFFYFFSQFLIIFFTITYKYTIHTFIYKIK